MRKFFVRLLIFLLVAAGAAWLLYPTVSDQVARWHNDTLMKRYHKAVLDMGSEQVEAMLQKAGSYNAGLEPEPLVKGAEGLPGLGYGLHPLEGKRPVFSLDVGPARHEPGDSRADQDQHEEDDEGVRCTFLRGHVVKGRIEALIYFLF